MRITFGPVTYTIRSEAELRALFPEMQERRGVLLDQLARNPDDQEAQWLLGRLVGESVADRQPVG